MFTCPVCGYPKLKEEPVCSGEICPCCYVESGCEDGGLAGGLAELAQRQLALRAGWLLGGARWHSRQQRPRGWSAEQQLKAAGLHVPDQYELARLAKALSLELLDQFATLGKPMSAREARVLPARTKKRRGPHMRWGAYNPKFLVGSRVRVAPLAYLDKFALRWKHHHPLSKKHFRHAGREATVQWIGLYHGGDRLYLLRRVPNLLWHECCLRAAR